MEDNKTLWVTKRGSHVICGCFQYFYNQMDTGEQAFKFVSFTRLAGQCEPGRQDAEL